jgi:acetyl esterase/lipase
MNDTADSVWLDPELAALVATVPRLDFRSLDELRVVREGLLKSPALPLPKGVKMQRHTIARSGDDGDLDLLVYRPESRSTDPLPCVYWMHGGGYVFGSPEVPPAHLLDWVREWECAVISVDYRVAPEAPFPAALEDARAGLTWVVDGVEQLGVDPDAIVLGGTSAGAGLGVALVRQLDANLRRRILLLLLFFPMIDDRMATPSSEWTVPIWGNHANAWSWKAYLGDRADDAVRLAAASARASAADLRGLPPSFIAVGTADLFLHEDLEFAANLAEAQVRVELHVYPGATHGFTSIFSSSSLAQRANRDATDALGRALTAWKEKRAHRTSAATYSASDTAGPPPAATRCSDRIASPEDG